MAHVGDWWDGQRWNRDEWDVAFDDGAVCRMSFRIGTPVDGLSKGLYD